MWKRTWALRWPRWEDLPEAKSHFERALQIDPNQPIAKENLDAVKKEMRLHS